MKLLQHNSLADTVDAVNEAFFMGASLAEAERDSVIDWIASRQGLKGSYCGMFAPTVLDLRRGIRLFTGEKVVSNAAIGHILGEEASRALILLNGGSVKAREALKRSNRGMIRALASCETPKNVRGFYCCGTCTAALWRHLAVGGLTHSKRRLDVGLKTLKKYRDGTGKWHRFPFYYTLLALNEIDKKQAIDEMRYAAGVCEAILKRYKIKNKIATRRRMLMEKILAKC
jgi:hypothetical protein